jgi:hypothetical protein
MLGIGGFGRATLVASLAVGAACVALAAFGQVPPVYQYPPPQPYPAQPYPPYPAQPYPAQPYPAQTYPGQPYPPPYPAQPYPAQPYPAQPYQQPYPGQPQTLMWTVTLGVCSDWSGGWNMQHVGPGHWIGTSVITVRSNQCTHTPIGTQLSANLDFTTYANRTWRATDTNMSNGSHCQYSGSINSNNSSGTGTYTCGVNGQLSHIIITSPIPFFN